MDVKISEVIEEFILSMEEDKSGNTISSYKTDLKQFDDFISCKEIEEIKNIDIVQFKEQLKNIELKPKTINRKLLSVKKLIDWINCNEEIDIEKFLKIKLIKIQAQDYLEEVLEMVDFERLMRMAIRESDRRAITLFNTLLLTGMRVSEVLQLKVADINKDFVNIIGKGEKSRDVLLSERLKDCMLDYVKDRGQPIGGYLFLNKENDNAMSRQSVDKVIKMYAGKAKVKLTKAHAHNFRHLSGLRMIEEGFTLDEVADILGHGNINTTRIYVRKTKKELLKAINRL